MNLHRCLAALFVLLALSGCAQVATEQAPAPVPSYPHDNGPDRRGDDVGGWAIGSRDRWMEARSRSLTASSVATYFALTHLVFCVLGHSGPGAEVLSNNSRDQFPDRRPEAE
jgi:uncharacterized protein YceK